MSVTPLSYIAGWLSLNPSVLYKASAAGPVSKKSQQVLGIKADERSNVLNTDIGRKEVIPLNCPVTSI